MELPNWFKGTGTDKTFAKHLSRLAGKPDLRFLQIGVFAGHASEWLMQNILTDPSSHLDDVDTWTGSSDIHDLDFTEVNNQYHERIKPYEKQVTSNRVSSVDFLLAPVTTQYDFIYIDGDHTAFAVLTDAVLAYQHLKVGGIIAFDDYRWRISDNYLEHPWPSVDVFGYLGANHLKTIEVGLQVWFRKTR